MSSTKLVVVLCFVVFMAVATEAYIGGVPFGNGNFKKSSSSPAVSNSFNYFIYVLQTGEQASRQAGKPQAVTKHETYKHLLIVKIVFIIGLNTNMIIL